MLSGSRKNLSRFSVTSVGPSGKNIDYFWNLANALREGIDPNDEHILELEKVVRRMMTEDNKIP